MKKTYSNVVIAIIFSILGFGFTIQMVNMKEDYSFVSLKTMSDLQNQIKKDTEENKNIRQLIEISNSRLKEYDKAVQEGGSIKEVLLNDLNDLKIVSGFVDLEGEGIIIKLSDSEREMYEWESPSDLIVHDRDVLMILNELKLAGAEAISINGQRLLANSEIKCAGPTITINNYTYGQPFIIKAIGDPETLEASIKSPDSYAYGLREYFDLIVETQISYRVRIPRFEGNLTIKNIQLKEGE